MIFGWNIIAYLFLAGAGAGMFFVAASSCMGDVLQKSDAAGRAVRTCQVGFFAAPCLMALAGLFLLLDVGNAQRVWLVFTMPFQSVLSVGAWLVVVLTLVAGTLAACGLLFGTPPRSIQWACCVIGWVCALGVMCYTGLLLSDMASIDFWHTPWLIVLFVVSSLSCGIAIIAGLDAVFAPPSFPVSRRVWRGGAVLGAIEVGVLAAFMIAQGSFTETARASCDLLTGGTLAPLFWGGVCAVGLAAPLILHAASGLLSKRAAIIGSSLCVLSGGLLLRYCLIAAALYTPLALGAI